MSMSTLSIGEVELLTGVKAHVLRYWEETVPFLAPQKDGFGRRLYSSRDVQLIMRLRFLIVDRKYTVEGAYEQLMRETTNTANSDVIKDINMLKNDLIELYESVRRQKGTEQKNE